MPTITVYKILSCHVQLEDKIADEKVLDEDLEDSLQQLRSLVNPWTLIEQQVGLCIRAWNIQRPTPSGSA